MPDDEIAYLENCINECQRVIDGTASDDDIDSVLYMIMQKFDRTIKELTGE